MEKRVFRKKNVSMIILIGVLLLTMCGCGTDKEAEISMGSYDYMGSANEFSNTKYGVVEMEESIASAIAEQDISTEETVNAESEISRKLVYKANIELESQDYESAQLALREAVEKNGGYLEEVTQYGSKENGNRCYNATVRIPAERYRDFLDDSGEVGNVTYLNESMQDITANYIDVQARLSSLEEQRDRLKELSKKAENLEDLLAIENQLSQVQYQLENYTSQMKYMNRQVSYSTIHLSLNEVVEYTPSNTFISRLKRALTGTWTDFFNDMGNVLIGLIYLLPYLILLAVAILAIRSLWKRFWEKKMKQ